MATMEKKIFVYEHWQGEEPSLIGTLYSSIVRGEESFSFEYTPEWLNKRDYSFLLDPDLSFYRGRGQRISLR